MVDVHIIHDILLLDSCTTLQLCQLIDRSRFKSDIHPLLFVEGPAGFPSLDQMLNLLPFLLSFSHGFGNIDS